MADAVHRVGRLKPLLEVRRYYDVGQNYALAEKIVYKDWYKETEVHVDIVQMGNPVGARRQWIMFGTMPWAWRYTPPSERATLPFFELLLNREARLTVRSFDVNNKEIPFPPKERWDKARFTDMFVRWKDLDQQYMVTRRCIPIVRVRRPQTAFLPISERPDQLFELGTTGLLHYPRDIRTRSGAVFMEPVQGGTQKELKTQVRNRYSSKRNPRTDTGQGSEYVISSSADGHLIASIEGEYQFRINIEDPYKPAAYNFEFESKEVDKVAFDGSDGSVRRRNWDEIELRVHHTSNVKVEAKANTKRFVLESTVLVLEENVVGPVGALGDPLPPRAKFSLLSKPPSAAPGFLYMIASMALAFVPVYGWIASLALTVGELVYTYKTGEDFFGHKVSPNELAALGILGMAGAVGDVLGALRLRRASIAITHDIDGALRTAFNQIEHEYNAVARGSFEAMESAGDQPIAKLIASLPSDKQAILAKLGTANLKPVEYLRKAGKLLSEHLGTLEKTRPDEFRLIVVSVLEGMLTPDGRTLASDYLRSAYEAYKRNARTKNPVDPITWLHRSRSRRVRRFLSRALGKNYRQTIRDAQKVAKGKATVMATEQNISLVFDFYDDLARLGLQQYKDLDALRGLAKYDPIRGLLRDCFQFEHAVELRFARNLDGKQHFRIRDPGGKTRFAVDPNPSGINVQREFQAVIVPRTRRHAVLLQGGELAPKAPLRYTQHPKTRLVSDRIPHGAEHLAEPQEIADAICTALLEVNFDRLGENAAEARKMMARLEPDFKTMTDLINDVRGTKFDYPILTTRLADRSPALLPGGKGWPRFARDRRGVWSIVNADEVAQARKERDAWAAAQRKK